MSSQNFAVGDFVSIACNGLIGRIKSISVLGSLTVEIPLDTLNLYIFSHEVKSEHQQLSVFAKDIILPYLFILPAWSVFAVRKNNLLDVDIQNAIRQENDLNNGKIIYNEA